MSSDVDKIKSRLSIVDVVAPYVDLKPAGSRLKGLSPFTREKTPSFFVSPEQGFYHCFSTDQGGDMFSFIQAVEGLDFVGALRLLADRAGVELTNNRSSQNKNKQDIYSALEAAANFFQASFKVSTAAQHFVKRRGINDDEVARFRIGYAPDDWRRLHEALGDKFGNQILLEAGLVKQKNNSTYDVFRDRVMFPIRDIAGRVVGFSGRRLDGEKAAKYLNSPESSVFKKSQVLYGLYEGRNEIRNLDFVLLVEGQIDLVMAHQVGSRNTVATSGTAFTAGHLNVIKRYTENILLAFDPDSAGIKASVKVAEVAYRNGMVVKSIELPADKDPADVINSDPDSWTGLIKESISFPALLAKKSRESSRNETHFNQTLRKVIVPLLSVIESPLQREHEVKTVAETVSVDVDLISQELEVYLAKQSDKQTANNYTQSNKSDSQSSRQDSVDSTAKILQGIADRVSILKNHYADVELPVLPDSLSELPEPSTATLLSRNVSGYKQILRELNQLIADHALREKRLVLEEKLLTLEATPDKSPDTINQIIQLRKTIEDLPSSLG